MKLITLHEWGGDLDDPIEVNPAMIFTLKAKGKRKSNEGTVINGTLTVRESIDEIKANLPKPPGRKPTY